MCGKIYHTKNLCGKIFLRLAWGEKLSFLDKCSPLETCHIVYHCNILSQVQLVKKFCPAEVRSVVVNYLNRNANMLTSEDEEERRFTVNVIKQIRKDAESADLGDSLPCQFETPSVNFDATNLQTLINWEMVKLLELLLTTTMIIADEVILNSPCRYPAPGSATTRLWSQQQKRCRRHA